MSFTEEELEAARNCKAQDVWETLKSIINLRFEVNDFLIRHKAEWDWSISAEDKKKWSVEKFSETNSSNRKYKVTHVDEVGLPYIQKVLFNGDLSGELICLASFDLEFNRFIQDPDFIDHTLLMEESDIYDPLEVYRENKSVRKRKVKQV